MARARNIKPGFFTNGDLADCSPLARLLYIGLWQNCDREGRLKDKPRDLKAKILPFDACDVSHLLDELEKTGFILRYSVESFGSLIWIPNFKKHQHVHPSEPSSELPDFNGEKIKPDLTVQKRPLTESLLLKDDIPPTPKKVDEGVIKFEEIWKAKWSRGDAANPKKPAFKSYLAAIKHGESHEQILAAVKSRFGANPKSEGTDKAPQLVTWLNQERWKDAPTTETPSPEAQEARRVQAAKAKEMRDKTIDEAKRIKYQELTGLDYDTGEPLRREITA